MQHLISVLTDRQQKSIMNHVYLNDFTRRATFGCALKSRI